MRCYSMCKITTRGLLTKSIFFIQNWMYSIARMVHEHCENIIGKEERHQILPRVTMDRSINFFFSDQYTV